MVRYTGNMTVRLGSKDVRVIDCHCHLGPGEWQIPASPATMFDVDGLRRRQDKAGVDLSVFGNNWIRTPEWVSALEVMRRYNDFAAEVTARHPDRLLGLASAVPFDGDEMLRETERAIRHLGLKAIAINSSVSGEYLDSPRAEAFFQLVTELQVPVFIHPPRVTIGFEKMEIFRLPEMVGRPFDTSLTLARFILLGGFERFPTLNLVCAQRLVRRICKNCPVDSTSATSCGVMRPSAPGSPTCSRRRPPATSSGYTSTRWASTRRP